MLPTIAGTWEVLAASDASDDAPSLVAASVKITLQTNRPGGATQETLIEGQIVEGAFSGKATRQLDPNGENPVTTVNIGHGLPRALVANGVSVASVADIDAYGLLTAVEESQRRQRGPRRA